MKQTMRFLLVLTALLGLMLMTQSSLTGACYNPKGGGVANDLNCPD